MKKIEINLIFEKDDIDMYDCGLDYKDLVNFPFSLIAVDDLDYNHAQFKKLVFLFL